MNARRSRQFLILAFAVSLLLHVILASGFRWPDLLRQQDQVEIVHIQHLSRTVVQHAATPRPPTPAPPNSPAPTTAPAKHPSRTISGPGGAGSGAATPAPAQTAAPTPIPVASAAPCTKGDVPVAVTQSPAAPEIPAAARGAATNGIARVRVTLDAAGAVQKALVVESTGNAALDLAAVSMARAAQYSPALHDCKPVAADYTFSVRFASW